MQKQAQKRALRRMLRDQRRALRPAQRRAKSRLIARHLAAHPAVRRAHTIAAYLALPDEVDLGELMRALPGKTWLVPKIVGAAQMQFVRLRPRSSVCGGVRLRVRRGLAGIAEPVGTQHHWTRDIELALLPLVGFDRAGNRLGQGGGFYDRFFAAGSARRTKLIGCAFDCQRREDIPVDPWDQTLDWITTESGVYRPRRGSIQTATGPRLSRVNQTQANWTL